MADVTDAHRRAVPVRDDHVVPWGRRRQLIVVVDCKRLFVSLYRPFWAVDGGDADLSANVLQLQAFLNKLRGINLNAHSGSVLAADAHQRHAGNLADALRKNIFADVVNLNNRVYV